MPWSSGLQWSPAVISDREKKSVTYRCLADGAALTPAVREVPATPAASEPADAGRTAAPAPSAPTAPATTQVTATTATSGRLPRRINDVIRSLKARTGPRPQLIICTSMANSYFTVGDPSKNACSWCLAATGGAGLITLC